MKGSNDNKNPEFLYKEKFGILHNLLIFIANPDKEPGCRFAPFAFPMKTGMSLRSICSFCPFLYRPSITRFIVAPICAGDSTTMMPFSARMRILAAAVSSSPPTMAPA